MLIFSLNRFQQHNDVMLNEKIGDLVRFPVYGLDMAPYVQSADQQQDHLLYDLQAVINHYGELNYGHYIACAKNSVTGQWHRYDDSLVTSMEGSEAELVTEAAYVLFYKLRGYEEAVGLVSEAGQ